MVAIPAVPQSWRRLLFLLPIITILVVLGTGLYNGALPTPRLPKVLFDDGLNGGHPPIRQDCKIGNGSTTVLDSIPDIVRAIWAPLLLPITAPTFKTVDGVEKHLPPRKELIHTKPMGKRICILDLDTRPLEDEGAVFNENLPTWDNLGSSSAGFLSHYLYAMIHGYTYKFIRAPQYADRSPHWSKVIFTKELLKTYDIVIMIDYDAMFTSPEVPVEWMLNYWKIDRDVMVAMSDDPPGTGNEDLRHRVNINSGFIIAQASNNTQKLFQDWAECPSEKRYKGCAIWKEKLFHEQAAFSSHVRYDFLDGLTIDSEPGNKYIRILPCSEANGIPEVAGCGCIGQLVRHYWAHKELTNREFSHGIMTAMTPLLVQAAFKQEGSVMDYREKVLQGAEILDKA